MTGHEIRQKFLDFFAERGHRVGPQLVAGSGERSDAAVHQRRHEPVQGRLPRPGEARLHARRHLAEMRPRRRQAQRSRERRLHAPPSHVLRDAGQLLLRRLLQSRSHRLRLGPADQGLRPAERTGSTSPSSAKTTKPKSCGRRSPAFPRTASSGSTRRTTSGRWARPVPAVPARRSTTISAPKPPSRAANTKQFPDRRRRTLRRDLESRLHAVRPRRRRHADAAAPSFDRHRHGTRARRRRAAGQAQQLRNRPARGRSSSTPPTCSTSPYGATTRDRHRAAHLRRPRPRRRVPDPRRRRARRTKAAATCCARSCAAPCATRA